MALASEPGAGGMVLLPYLDGERTPDLPDATGTLAGLRTDTEPAQLARAAYEGVVCGLLEAFHALGAAGVPTEGGRVIVVGGGARSSVYPQVLADLLQRPVGGRRRPPNTWRAARACRPRPYSPVVTSPQSRASGRPTDSRTVEPDPKVDAAGVRAAVPRPRLRTHPESGDRT